MHQRLKKILPILTIIGFGIYLLLFIIAVLLFSGGNSSDACEEGFNFFHNYWCDLMNPFCPIGVVNSAMFYARLGHIVLSVSTGLFFLTLPYLFEDTERKSALTIRAFGAFSMFIFSLMFTSFHNQVITATALFGTIALVTSFLQLKKIENRRLFYGAVVCLFCCLSVFLIYQSKIGIYWLPLAQKITIFIALAWMIWVCVIILKKYGKNGMSLFVSNIS